jgi:2-(1,2-epoxy-1,2-dihydrophenyl)acetyl-CoA isomerase
VYETIKWEQKKGVAFIILNRPERLNAFNTQMNNEIIQAIKIAARDEEVRCVVLTGEGRAFSAGEDLQGLGEETDHGDILRTRYNPTISAIANLEKPIVAAVNGVAAGSGFSLALACDFILASEKASFAASFIHIGLVPDSGMLYYLPRIAGNAKALELVILGERISADKADQLGLVTKIISTGEWESQVEEFAEKLGSQPTKAIGLIKRYLKESLSSSLEEMLEKEACAQRIAGLSKDYSEGVSAFLEKRKPIFTGK